MQVLICDDHRLVSESLALVFRMAGHEVVGVVEFPAEAEAVIRARPVDVCLLDLWYGDIYGMEEVASLTRRFPEVRMVVLSGHLDTDCIEALRQAGAYSWAMKGGRLDQVVRLVESDTCGTVVADHLDRWDADPLGRFLTTREREVLARVAGGETTAALATRLGVSHATVRTHIQSILSKLGVHSRLEAVAYAVSRSLIVPDRRSQSGDLSA